MLLPWPLRWALASIALAAPRAVAAQEPPRAPPPVLQPGVGVGFATAGTATITAPGDPVRDVPAVSATLYDGLDKVRILGTLGLGVAF